MHCTSSQPRASGPAAILRERLRDARTPAERLHRLAVLATYELREEHRRAFVARVSLGANDGADFTREPCAPGRW